MATPETVYGDATVLITGASSGIGAALAQEIGRHGGRLALVARRVERLEALARELRERGCTAHVVAADVSDPEQVRQAHQEIGSTLGAIDIAFLNAGVSEIMPLSRFDGAVARRLFEVNVFGVINWLDVLLPDMAGRGSGIIAATSSLAAGRAAPGIGVYSATKAAVSSLFDAMRAEGQRKGVQLTLIEPGFVVSEMTAEGPMPMPFIVQTRDAARIIAREVAAGALLIRFPWQHAAAMQLLKQLPNAAYDRLMRSMGRSKRR